MTAPKQKLSLFKIFLVAACIIFVGLIISAVRESNRVTSIPEVEVIKSRQHLEEAKKAIEEGRIADAKEHLQEMNKFSQDWNSEGKVLWDKIGSYIQHEKHELERQKKEQTIQLRKEFANKYEKELLTNWLNAYVTTSGAHHDIIEIKHISINRPFVHNFNQNRELIKNLHELGFVKVILLNGYDFNDSVYVY